LLLLFGQNLTIKPQKSCATPKVAVSLGCQTTKE
jgi:hypothetical protein